jgi:hypothetical protein
VSAPRMQYNRVSARNRDDHICGGVGGQSKRYARDIRLTPDEISAGSPWINGLDRFRVPFLFVTNGRPYVKQLATKSGSGSGMRD